ncbi:hypothetical protein A0O34_21550 [Chryseobacterium glaciei]|uniref:Uncharacterized protein n=2 Tax=Chryseobacterium glaciei TaxID=1685010 RepID=A0A172Y110_9FLAO|nr:hypothetical protein A0O34_21550 [Chryseobacterium glaciei]
MHSCRQQDEAQDADLQTQVSKSDTEIQRGNDTINTASIPGAFNGSKDFDDDTTITDPPPKDRDQWRNRE